MEESSCATEPCATEPCATETGATGENQLIFYPNGRLGNAIFRYMACAMVNLINPSLRYTLKCNAVPASTTFTYYPGVDHAGDDFYQAKDKDSMAMEKEALENNAILAYNTLGFFKHTIDVDHFKSNPYINQHNGQGLYVKNTITLNDDNFFDLFYKKLKYFNVCMDGYFQFGYIYSKFKPQILAYMETHKDTHYIQTDINERFLIRDIVDELILPVEKQYDIAIHLRLGDFNGRPDFIELEHYINLFASMQTVFEGKKVCLIYQPSHRPLDNAYIQACVAWFQDHAVPLHIESSNSLLVDFNIMKQVDILVCSMSTFAWSAAYLSKQLKQCYMPDYNFYQTDRQATFFHKPIPNTILYRVKSTPPLQLKTYILTLPEYASRLAALDGLNQQLSTIGLDATIYNGVHGKDIHIYEAAAEITHIKHITWQETTYFYDTRVRINGQPMTRGEFGCAWSHLNLLRQLVADTSVAYYLVLEDDVELVQPLADLNQLLQHLPADTDMCHLAKSDFYPFIQTTKVNDYFYKCEKRYFNRTTAYIVSAKGAQKILDYTSNSINVPMDDLFNTVYRVTPDFRFYVPATYFFKEQENTTSTIKAINHS